MNHRITPSIALDIQTSHVFFRVFFPAYVPHEFSVDMGVDDFRFIHFNLQAIRKTMVGNNE